MQILHQKFEFQPVGCAVALGQRITQHIGDQHIQHIGDALPSGTTHPTLGILYPITNHDVSRPIVRLLLKIRVVQNCQLSLS
jgi:hypothetical protein